MSGQTPLALTFKGPNKKWWYGGSAAVIIVGLLIAYSDDTESLGLDVKRGNIIDAADDGRVLIVTNAGTRPVTINQFVVNERPDCNAWGPRLPAQLNVGDRQLVSSNCRIVRVEIDAKEGSESYEFGG
jgi:hypothetical protein